VHERNEPDVLTDLRHADVLSRKDLAEIHLPSFEADLVSLENLVASPAGNSERGTQRLPIPIALPPNVLG
jgi:hypothetical protein